MRNEQKVEVLRLIAVLGFESAFDDALRFDDINDPEFHRCLVMYKRARRQLSEYIGYPNDLDLLEKDTQM